MMAKTQAHPHVVVFICDQMQAQRLGAVDNVAVTPTLDGLAKQGIVFSNMFCSSAQCVPSRVSLQTGLYPHEAQVMTNFPFFGHTRHIDDTFTTIGHVFKNAGYATAYFGKRHFGYPINRLGYEISNTPRVPGSNADKDRVFNDETLAFLRTYDRSHPLFLTVSYHEPHPPFELVPGFSKDYDTDTLPLPLSFYQDDLSTKPRFQREHANTSDHGVKEEVLRYELSCYYSMISHVDALVHEVLQALSDQGMRENTIVFFTSDHGDMMGSHRMRLKGTLPYDELFRVPAILQLPNGRLGGRVVDRLVSNTAIPGTILEAAGMSGCSSQLKDRSVLALAEPSEDLRSPSPPSEEMVFFEHYAAYWGLHPFRAIRMRFPQEINSVDKALCGTEWKYVYYYGLDQCEELYNLTADPDELVNLAEVDTPNLGLLKATLSRHLNQWWMETGGREFSEYEQDAFKLRQDATFYSELEYGENDG